MNVIFAKKIIFGRKRENKNTLEILYIQLSLYKYGSSFLHTGDGQTNVKLLNTQRDRFLTFDAVSLVTKYTNVITKSANWLI